MPDPQPQHFDRRNVILAGGALVGAAALGRCLAQAADSGLAPAGDLLAAVQRFLAGLEPEQRKATSFAWDGPEWRGWSYFGFPSLIKPGLRLEQMSAAQKETAWDALATLLSPAGVQKTKNVMTLQGVLAAQGNAPA